MQKKNNEINKIADRDERDVQSGIFGKIKEYALRFSAILHLSDKTLEEENEYSDYILFEGVEKITTKEVNRAIKLAEYFYTSAIDTYKMVQTTNTAPAEVLTVAALLRMGHSQRSIAKAYYGKDDAASTQKMFRQIKKWIFKYPRVFQAIAK